MQTDETKMLLAKLKDAYSISQRRPSFLGFLNEHEVAVVEDDLHKSGANYLLWGGHPQAERKVIGIFPDYMNPEERLFPVQGLTFLYREQDVLSHRDFLGAFMALGLRRSVVGDILPEAGRTVVFFKEEIKPYIRENVRKVGNVGVQILDEVTAPLPLMHTFQTLSGVIASERLDCMVAFLCRTSREKSAGIIKNGLVQRNHREVLSPSEHIVAGDILSIKQKGKFLIDQLGPVTHKGRLSVRCRKYR